MKRAIAGTFFAAVFSVGLAAQATTPPSQPMQEVKDKDAAKTVTVTGCLKAGETADSFLLSDLKWSQDKAVGTSGAAAPAAPAISATALKLIGSPSIKLSDHVGHTVELTGTIADKADKAMGATPPDAAAPRPAPAASAPSLNVKNVKMVAATCSTQ